MDELTDLTHRVASELEALCGPGAPLHEDSSRATHSLYKGDSGRRDFKRDLIEEILSVDEDVSRDGRIAIVTAGPPGAGKSHLIDSLLEDTEGYRHIDPDDVKERLVARAVEDGIYDDLLSQELHDGRSILPLELAGLVHGESTRIAASMRRRCMRRGENVVIHGTLAWSELPNRYLLELESQMYSRLEIIDVRVELEIARQQALHRWWTARQDAVNHPDGGRFVPQRVIDSHYQEGGTTSVCGTNAETMFSQSQDSSLRTVNWSICRQDSGGHAEIETLSLRANRRGRLVPVEKPEDGAENVVSMRRASSD